jgi:RNA polymerase sigma factor (sigma-70 family)
MEEKEKILWENYDKDRTDDNRNALVENYDLLIWSTIKKMNLYEDLNDLHQMGVIAIIKGIESYDKTKDVSPMKYLSYKIRQNVIDQLREINKTRSKYKIHFASLDQLIEDSEEEGMGNSMDILAVTDDSEDMIDFLDTIEVVSQSLGDRVTKMIIWRIVDDLSFDEIAQRLEISPGRVSQIWKSILPSLQNNRHILEMLKK